MLRDLTISKIVEGIKKGQLSSYEIVKECIEEIEKDNSSSNPINAFITLMEDYALEQAKYIDEQRNKLEGKLLGVPIAIKDNINVKSFPTTCASKILEGFISVEDATVVERIKNNFGVIIGKTNMDEFAMGSSNET